MNKQILYDAGLGGGWQNGAQSSGMFKRKTALGAQPFKWQGQSPCQVPSTRWGPALDDPEVDMR